MNDLFSSSFLAGIEQLSLDVAAAAPRVVAGSHLSRTSGNSLDFRDFREYSPGDDLRRVDWNVYRRSGHLFLRRFEHPTTTPLHILLDTSESMFVETPSRYAAAARVTAAVAAAALREHDGVSIVPFSSNTQPPLTRLSGRRRLPEVLEYLTRLTSGGAGSFGLLAQALNGIARAGGVAVVISDFFEDVGPHAISEALADLQHRLALVQIIQPDDSEPQLDSEYELVDCESARSVKVLANSPTLARYRQAYASFQTALDDLAARRASIHVKINAAADPLLELGKLFPAGVLHVAEVRR